MPLSGALTDEERKRRLRAIQTQFGIGTPGMGIAPMQGDARVAPRQLTPSPVATGRTEMRSGLAGVRQPEPGMGRLFAEEALGTVRRGLSTLGGATVLPLSFARAVGERAGTTLDQPVRPFSEIHRETVGGVEEPMRQGLNAVRRGMAQVGMIPPSWAPGREQTAAPIPVDEARQVVTPRREAERVATGLEAARVAQEQAAAEEQLPLSMAARADRVGAEGGILTPKGEIVSESDAQVAMMARQEAEERAAALERDARIMRDREFRQGLASGRVWNPITQQFDTAAPSTLVAAGTLGLPVRGGRMIDTETFRAPRIGAGLGSAREMRVAAGQGTGEERGTQERRSLRERAEAELMAGVQERTAQREHELALGRQKGTFDTQVSEIIAKANAGKLTNAEVKAQLDGLDESKFADLQTSMLEDGIVDRPAGSVLPGGKASGNIVWNIRTGRPQELTAAEWEKFRSDPEDTIYSALHPYAERYLREQQART